VAEVLDLSEMEIIAKVGELDRANLHEGQEVKFQLDAIPDKTFHGKIKGMSGTATADPFNGDPAKKFDVIFSVDMKELMTVLGATPEQIRKVEETAARNAKNAPTSSVAARLSALEAASAAGAANARGGAAGMPGMPGADGGAADDSGGDGGGRGGGRRGGGGGGGGRGADGGRGGGGDRMARMMEQLPDAVKKDIAKDLKGKKLEDLAPEDRAKIMAKIREAVPGGFGGGRGGRGGGGGRGGDGNARDAAPDAAQIERDNAKLPPPPEEDSQLDVLLRPGMLADVEITVEKIPDAISVPNQAVFEKGGRTIVYVENPTTHRFDERAVKLAKRSESVMVIADGLQNGETIALGDPTAQKSDKGAEAPKSLGAMPGAGAAGKGK